MRTVRQVSYVGIFEISQSKEGSQWRWKFVSGNNKTISESVEGYPNSEDCMADITLVKMEALGATIKVLPQPQKESNSN